MRLPTRRHVTAAACATAFVALAATPAHATDSTAPDLRIDSGLVFKVGSVLSDSTTSATIPATVTWSASDDVGIDSQYGVFYRSWDGAEWYPALPAPRWTVPGVFFQGAFSADVTVVDAAGNATNDLQKFTSRLVQQRAMTASEGWTRSTCGCWSGGSVLKSTEAGASLSYQFTGDSVAVIGDRAADRGVMKVYIDGRLRSSVSTAGSTTNRVVVFQKRFGATGTHTIELVAETAARIDVDALIVQD